MHTAAPKILCREQEPGWQLVLDSQTPLLRIQIPAVLPLQGARVCGHLLQVGDSREIRGFLLKAGSYCRGLGSTHAERIALQASVQIIILSRPVVDAKASANDRLPMECRRRPCEAHARIEVFVIRLVQSRILWGTTEY